MYQIATYTISEQINSQSVMYAILQPIVAPPREEVMVREQCQSEARAGKSQWTLEESMRSHPGGDKVERTP